VGAGEGQGAGRAGLGGWARVAADNHDPCYHELAYLSNTIIVLVFSELTSFVRKILQGEENKGVELTVCPCNGSGAMECGGRVRPGERGRGRVLSC
jgi:hypothetical protein